MRSHFYRPIVDLVGGLYEYAQVRVLNEDGGFLGQTVWHNGDDLVALSNPFTCVPAIVEFYLDNPQRVLLEITVPGSGPMDLEAVDVGPPAVETVRSVAPIFIRTPPAAQRTLRARTPEMLEWGNFVANHDHKVVGIALGTDVFATASGARSIIVGDEAGRDDGTAVADTVAIGHWSEAWGDRAVAVGHFANGNAEDGVAVGAQAWAHTRSVGLGDLGRALSAESIALGRSAVTDYTGQVVISKDGSGTQGDDRTVAIRGVADSPDGVAIGNGARAVHPTLTGAHVMLGSGPLDSPDLPAVSPPASDSVISWRPTQEPSIPGVLDVAGEAVLGAAGGLVGHFGATPVAKPTVTGSEGLNVALGYLLSALEDMGLVVRGTTDGYIPPQPLTAQGAIIDRPIRPLTESEDYVPAGGWPTVTEDTGSITIAKNDSTTYPTTTDSGSGTVDAPLTASKTESVQDDSTSVITDSTTATAEATLTASKTETVNDDSPAVITDSATQTGGHSVAWNDADPWDDTESWTE